MMPSRTAPSSPLWLAVYCRHWPLRALTGAIPTSPVRGDDNATLHAANDAPSTIEDQPHAVMERQLICDCNAPAAALGVSIGMSSAVAATLLNAPLLNRDPKREALLQQALCEACYSVSPYVVSATDLIGARANGITVPAGVALEVSSCLQLFKGIEGIIEHVRQCLSPLAIEAYWAWAHSSEGAWLLSKAEAAPLQLPPGGACQPKAALLKIYALPLSTVAALGADIERLQAIGFNTLGDICSSANTWHAIKKRLAISSITYLEALLGGEAQGSLFHTRPAYFQPALSFSDGLDAEYPINTIEWLHPLTEQLLARLTAFLIKHQCQVQHLHWRLYNIGHDCHSLDVHLERLFSDAALAADITRIHLEQQGLPFEVDRLELHCQNLQPLHTESHALWAEPSQQNREALARLNAKLQSRMGEGAFYKVSCCDGLLPEACMQKINVQQAASSKLPRGIAQKYRPMWLLEPPESIEQRGGELYWHGQLVIISEAERIQTNWWQKAAARDYYLAKRDDQQLLWLYQDLHRSQWYVHGIFG